MAESGKGMKVFGFIFAVLMLMAGGCASREEVAPGRGAEMEVGAIATVFPSGSGSVRARHGLWRGMNGDQLVWEVRYTRGVPTGPYREWNEQGEMIATWPYNWDGLIEGQARWFEGDKQVYRREITVEEEMGAEWIGKAAGLRDQLSEMDSK